MKSYIPHKLFVINDFHHMRYDDPVLMRCMQLAFDWANAQGLEGKKVYSLYLEPPDPLDYNPMRQHYSLWCCIECTEEERKAWEQQRDKDIEHCILEQLKEEDA